MTFAQKDLNELINDLTLVVPHLVPFLFVFPCRVIQTEEWNTLVNQGRKEELLLPTAFINSNELCFVDTFLEGLTENKRRGIIIHEVLHPALGHLSDPFTDYSLTPESFARLKNVAQDIVIEGLIDDMASGYQPSLAREDRSIMSNYPPDIYEPHKGKDWITVYRELKESSDIKPSPLDVISPYATDAEIKGVLDAARKESAAIVERLRSTGTAKDLVAVKLVQPVVSWAEVLKKHILEKPCNTHRSWKRINRRHYATTGEYKPRMSGSTVTLGKVHIFVDVSGSTHSLLKNVASDLDNLMKNLQPKEVSILYYDTEVIQVCDLTDKDDIDFTTMPAGGGTCVVSALGHYCLGKDPINGPTIILTDGEDNFQFTEHVRDYLGDSTYILSYRYSLTTNHGIYLPVRV